MNGKSDAAPKASPRSRLIHRTGSTAPPKRLVGQHLAHIADRKDDRLDYRNYELSAGLWLMRRRELDLVAKLVYFALEYQNGGGKPYADPPESILAHMLGITEREVRRGLAQLRRLELIELLRKRSERGRKAYRFTNHVWMYLDPVSAHRSGRDVVGWEAAGIRPASTFKVRGARGGKLPLISEDG